MTAARVFNSSTFFCDSSTAALGLRTAAQFFQQQHRSTSFHNGSTFFEQQHRSTLFCNSSTGFLTSYPLK